MKTHRLVSLANNAGGDDNITVLLVTVEESRLVDCGTGSSHAGC